MKLLPPYYGSSSDTVFGVKVFGSDHGKKWWHRYGVMPIYRFVRKIDNTWMWFKYRVHPDWRHHVIKTDLEPGWCDVDEIMFRGCFTLLRRFVEWELGKVDGPGEFWGYHRGYRVHSGGGTDEKAIDLWLWYKEELPKLYAAEKEAYENKAPGWYNMSSEHEKIKTEKLSELIAMRQTLWT